MKYLTLALVCSTVLFGCGGSDDTQPRANLNGLWEADTFYDLNSGLSETAPAGEMYMLMEDATADPFEVSFYTKADNLNCFEIDSGNVSHLGKNQFKNTNPSAPVYTMTTAGNTLSFSINDEQEAFKINLQKTVSISKADLPVCAVQNDAIYNDIDSVIQDGASKTIKSMFMYFSG